ncbi:helix-turn-helix domain-containing protein [Actinoplanes sp. NPDC049548]|uniref:TetR/AcrR family transcriptional regulator n=1 Tax=Actinoplanes sp. NPDC049548 TaxID=3155152 RepID=UPI00341C248D
MHAAIETLDAGGVDALTFRSLASQLSTGSGAIYHHVANKEDLLTAAADAVMTSVLDGAAAAAGADASQGVRAVVLGVFDAISAHPWVGTQLAAAPWQPAVLRLFDRVGAELDALGVPERAQFDAASVLVHHVLGVASQYDAGAHLASAQPGGRFDRSAFLDGATSALTGEVDAADLPFLTRVVRQLQNHDDREQFRAGVEIILVGISHL